MTTAGVDSSVQAASKELESVPVGREAALRVVRLVDDPKVGSADVAQALALDPALTARVLQVANSAYYGMSGRIRTTAFAVTVVGFQTVRSLAALAAAGVTQKDALPRGFWQRSAAAAAGGALLAPRAGCSSPDAFCVGMLHDLGTILLWRRDRKAYEGLPVTTSELPLVTLEQRAFGTDHATLCADVLGAWSVPEDLCAAIARHHDEPSDLGTPLRKALQAGIALGQLSAGSRDPVHRAALTVIGVPDRDIPALLLDAEQVTRQLAAVLAG